MWRRNTPSPRPGQVDNAARVAMGKQSGGHKEE